MLGRRGQEVRMSEERLWCLLGPAMDRASKARARAACGRGMAWDERHCSAVHMQHGEAAGRPRRDTGALAKRIRHKVEVMKLGRLAVRLSALGLI